MRIAVLDDWQKVARKLADWSPLERLADVRFFHAPFASEDEAARELADFGVILAMRERTPFPPSLVARLPRLKMFGMTGHRARGLDIEGMIARGITVSITEGGERGSETAEHALALMMAAVRQIPQGDASIRAGAFQENLRPGIGLAGRRLGIVGFGRIGKLVAGYGQALGMEVIAWSRSLTPETAGRMGVRSVSREEIFSLPDILSVHVHLTPESAGLITDSDLRRMKPGAILVNTSRSQLIERAALLSAVTEGRITAALDVFDHEPLPADDPFRKAPNTVLTPHLGYCTDEVLQTFYEQTVENALAYLKGAPIRPHALTRAAAS